MIFLFLPIIIPMFLSHLHISYGIWWGITHFKIMPTDRKINFDTQNEPAKEYKHDGKFIKYVSKLIIAMLVSVVAFCLSPTVLLSYLISNLAVGRKLVGSNPENNKPRSLLDRTLDLLQNIIFISLEITFFRYRGGFDHNSFAPKDSILAFSEPLLAFFARSYFIARAADSLVEFCKAVKEYFWKPAEVKNLDYVADQQTEDVDATKETQPQEESWLDPSFLAKAAAFVALDALLPGSALAAGGSWVAKVTQSMLGGPTIDR